MERGPRYGIQQGLLRQQDALLLHCRPFLSEAGRLVCCPELLLALERCDEVTCDDTGRHRVLRGLLFWVRQVQSRLFHLQVGDPLPWCPFSQVMEEGRQEPNIVEPPVYCPP